MAKIAKGNGNLISFEKHEKTNAKRQHFDSTILRDIFYISD
ncbi:hypothetical protein [Desulfobacula sp.]|nr:hypothetical protein [Desulfobacula sp.]